MQCIRPIKAGYDIAGDITYSSRKMSKELVSFAFPCRKCLPCRLNQAREKAIRVYHESKMHSESIFLTLTYNEESLKSPLLQFHDFQQFIDSLRTHIYREAGATTKEAKEILKISYMVTGEYGDLNKRPHWHIILFNYRPSDQKKIRSTELDQEVFTSELLTNLWGKGNIEYGSVTIDSANYVARYAAKKLTHGKDQDHNFHPIHTTSKGRAIGRSWIEKYYKHTFENGFVVLPNGQKSNIPRYYVDWAKKHQPEIWEAYVTQIKPKTQKLAETNAKAEEMEDLRNLLTYRGHGSIPLKRKQVKETILQSKFKRLQEKLKL